jgi:hypothetical protein
LGYLSQNKNENKQILAFGEPIRSTTNPDKKKKNALPALTQENHQQSLVERTGLLASW